MWSCIEVMDVFCIKDIKCEKLLIAYIKDNVFCKLNIVF